MTKQELEDKLAEFDKNDDKDSEHYCYGTSTQKIISRQLSLRRLKSEKLTDELFTESLKIGDSVIQIYLLELADNNQLKQLLENGATKTIINKTEKLNRIKR